MSFASFETVMSEQQENRATPPALPRRQQVLILGALAAVASLAAAILFLGGAILGHGEARAQAAQPQLSRFIPPKQQLAALEIEPVPLYVFHNEVITDGTIAANGGFAPAGGGGAIFSIGNGAHVWLIADVREEDAPKVHLGDDIEVKVAAYPAQLFKSRLGYMAPLIDPNTHRLVVGALVPNPDGTLRPNMSATVVIKGGQGRAAPAIPSRAVIYEGDTARVWVAGNDGSLALRDVTLGRTNGDRLEVTRGLSGGEKIVTSGALFIDRAASGE
jgi:multidrug efflux pump subunit AcrA (membrane-fusion protein)